MDILEAILSAESTGAFIVLTHDEMRTFPNIEECKAFSTTVSGPFAILQSLIIHHPSDPGRTERFDKDAAGDCQRMGRIEKAAIWATISQNLHLHRSHNEE